MPMNLYKRIKIIRMYLDDNLLMDEQLCKNIIQCTCEVAFDQMINTISKTWGFDLEEVAMDHYWIALHSGWYGEL